MGVNSLPKTATRQRRGCDLNPGPSAPESSTLTTRLPSHPLEDYKTECLGFSFTADSRTRTRHEHKYHRIPASTGEYSNSSSVAEQPHAEAAMTGR